MRRDRAAFVRLFAVLLILVLAFVGPSAVSSPAQATDTGSISGVVTDARGEAVASARVSAYYYDGWEWAQVKLVWTADDGSFRLPSLVPGTYRVRFQDQADDEDVYLDEYWDDAPNLASARNISVVSGEDVGGTNAQLSSGGHITGTITGSADAPVPSITVTAYGWNEAGGYWDFFRSTHSRPDGVYDVGTLPAGVYRLGFDDYRSPRRYFTKYWGNADTVDAAAEIVVERDGIVRDKDVQLTEGGSVKGTVTAEDGALRQAITAKLFRWDTTRSDWWQEAETEIAPGENGYEFTLLTADRYRIAFSDPDRNHPLYDTEYWDNSEFFATASPIDVELGATFQADAEISERGGISGTVTDTHGDPLKRVFVTPYVWVPAGIGPGGWFSAAGAWTAADGSYTVSQLPSHRYRLKFEDASGAHMSEFWNDAADIESATDVVVAGGKVHEGVDAQLQSGGSISGTVTGRGHPVLAIRVTAYRWDNTSRDWEGAGAAQTDVSGRYTIDGLTAGRYRIGFSDYSHYVYTREYWDDVVSVDNATDIDVSLGQNVTDVDADLAPKPDAGGSIIGKVTGPEGPDAVVTAYRRSSDGSGWDLERHAYTDENGNYYLDQLDPGTYKLHFGGSSSSVVDEYWNNASSFDDAADINVADQTVVTDVNAELVSSPFDYSISNREPPAITGLGIVGAPIAATPGTWSPSTDLTYTYRWVLDDTHISNSTGSTYVPVLTDVGKWLQVQVRVSRSGYRPVTGYSSYMLISQQGGPVDPLPNLSLSGIPTISSGRVGSPTTPTRATWVPAAERSSYQWFLDGVPIAGATGSSYTPGPDDLAKMLRVEITGYATGFLPGIHSTRSVKIQRGYLRTSSRPKVTGKTKKGATLIVSPGSWSPKPTTKIQWYAGAKPIAKATTTRLRLVGKTLKAVAGKAISVVVTTSAPGYTTVATRLKVAGKT